MIREICSELRALSSSMQNCIVSKVEVLKAERCVNINVVTDREYKPQDNEKCLAVLKKYVPNYFNTQLNLSKLSPDTEIVKRKIRDIIKLISMPLDSTMREKDLVVSKTEDGFQYTLYVMSVLANKGICDKINAILTHTYCGNFYGNMEESDLKGDDLEIEESYQEPEYTIPVRHFEIENFEPLESEKKVKTATYISDINYVEGDVVICGVIEEIRERTYNNKQNIEKSYLVIELNDATGSTRVTYFPRQKNIDKIKELKVGDSIVVSGRNENYNNNLRYTAQKIDFGKIPTDFQPEKRKSKPVPKYYSRVKPQPYVDIEQANLFEEVVVPECLKGNTFVVFDLETTGLNTIPQSGNMDKIIEIGAFKIKNGVISESFATFINPEKRLSKEIVDITGITEEMIKDAPTIAEAMPDFVKFAEDSILVGHNLVNFDFKFVDHYSNTLDYHLERKLIDTLSLSAEVLSGLSNYKLNTIADRFGIVFNHHRAIDDALATAKIFIELIKIKKSLPKLQ